MRRQRDVSSIEGAGFARRPDVEWVQSLELLTTMHACAAISSLKRTVIIPSGSFCECAKRVSHGRATSRQPRLIADAHIIQGDVRHFSASLLALVPHVFFQVEQKGRVFFQLGKGEHVRQDDDARVAFRRLGAL